MPERILVITGLYVPEIGGPATYTALLEEELPKHGIAVSVLPFRDVRHLPKVIRHVVFFFKTLHRARNVDLVFAQDPMSVGLPGLLACKLMRKPFVVRIAGDYAWEQAVQRFGVVDDIDTFQSNRHGLRTRVFQKLQSFVARQANLVITPSEYFSRLVRNWMKDQHHVITIYNGIRFDELPKCTQAPQQHTVLSAGRLVPWKGFDTLISLMQELPDWTLLIVGDGPDRTRLEKYAVECEVSDRVEFLGSLSRADLAREVCRANVFVLNTSFESFSFQVVEAMHLGTPVITTKVGSLPELIDPENNEGILIAPNDKQAIHEHIHLLEVDSDKRLDIIKRAQNKAQKFSLDKTVSELVVALEGSVKNSV